jgi:hypothetical protein
LQPIFTPICYKNLYQASILYQKLLKYKGNAEKQKRAAAVESALFRIIPPGELDAILLQPAGMHDFMVRHAPFDLRRG